MLNQIFISNKLREKGFTDEQIETILDINSEDIIEKNKFIRVREDEDGVESLILEFGGFEQKSYSLEDLNKEKLHNIIHDFIKNHESSTKQFVSAIMNGYLADPGFYDAVPRADTLLYFVYSSISQDYTMMFYDSPSIQDALEEIKGYSAEPFEVFNLVAYPYLENTKDLYLEVIERYKNELELDNSFELTHHTDAITDIIVADLANKLCF